MPLVWRSVNPDLLYAPFRDAITTLFADSPDRWVCTHGLRTVAEQHALAGRGRTAAELVAMGLSPADAVRYAAPEKPRVTNAIGGQSAHNWGCAIDVVLDADPTTEKLEPDWSPSPTDGWAWLQRVTTGHPTLKGGWTWQDWPHIEWRAWRHVRAARRRA